MIEQWFRIICDVCETPHGYKPVEGEDSSRPANTALLAAERDGWKVHRLAQDLYYGQAWCWQCREDRCRRCWSRGIIPDFKNMNGYGEPTPVECPNCKGLGHV